MTTRVFLGLLLSSFFALSAGCGMVADEPSGTESAPGSASGDGGTTAPKEGGVAPADGAHTSGNRPGNGPGSAKPTCEAPAVVNDPRCPPKYTWSMCQGTVCPATGLECAYPNSGDGPMSDGCLATAMMWCRPEGFVPGTDAGPHAGADASATPSKWICAQ